MTCLGVSSQHHKTGHVPIKQLFLDESSLMLLITLIAQCTPYSLAETQGETGISSILGFISSASFNTSILKVILMNIFTFIEDIGTLKPD